LAENHNKPIFPIMVKRRIVLDPAMQYTLAKAPKFFLKDPNYLKQLIYFMELSDRVSLLNKKVNQISAKLGETEKLVKQQKMVMGIKV